MQQINDQLKAIANNRTRVAELTQALENVPANLLEKLRVKLRATIDNEDTDLPKDVERLDERVAKKEAALAALHEQKEKVSEKINRLQELRTRVQRSTLRHIPDDFVRHVRRDNSNGAAQRTIYVDHRDDWMTNYLYYSTMMNMMDQSSSRSHHHASESPSNHSSIPTGDHYGSR